MLVVRKPVSAHGPKEAVLRGCLCFTLPLVGKHCAAICFDFVDILTILLQLHIDYPNNGYNEDSQRNH